MSDLSISMLGPFAASLNGEPLTQFGTKSVQALLIYLVCEARRPHQREALMDLIWPGMPLKSSQHNLRQTIYLLRKIIPEVKGKDGADPVPFILADRQTVQINPAAAYFADVQRFTTLTDADPGQAVTLYRGDFLSDFYLPDSEPFEEWASARRADFRRQVLLAMDSLTAEHLQQANYDEAEQLARRQLEIDNLREHTHRQLLEALARSGNRQDALAHFESLRQLLHDELAIEPEPETITLIEAIRTGELAREISLSSYQPLQISGEPKLPRHNLPQRLTSFVGRQKELEEISRLIDYNRLVMLTGVGGIGKTNLCIEVGFALLDEYPDGVWLVELASISDPALVPQTAASALGLRESSSQPVLDTLLDFLQERRALLILDNCEHLNLGAAQLAETVLQTCPGVKILASSREAFSIPGELTFAVPPLSFPNVHQLPSLEVWDRYDALCLFVDRATAVLPTFHVTKDNFAPMVQICQQLDGIPLALELAAARMNVLTVEQIAIRLDDRFHLLTGGSRTALPRHQTLRALIDWSWDLLDDTEQLLLQRLFVFAGGTNLEAVESVCAGDGLDASDVLDLLIELVNKSMVTARRVQGQETRYRLLETIRQYAREQLAADQEEKYRERHLQYFLRLGEEAEQALVGPNQVAWMNRLEMELDNARAALKWALATDIEAGLRLCSAIWRFWDHALREGEIWLADLLARAETAAPRVRAKALLTRSRINSYLFEIDIARMLAEEGLGLYREIGDQQGIAWSLFRVAYNSNKTTSKKLSKESLDIFRALGDKLGIAVVLFELGFHEENYEQGKIYYQESEALCRELGHLAGLADALSGSGQWAIWHGDLDFARPKIEESIELSELLGLAREDSLTVFGLLHFRLGDFQKAHKYLKKGLQVSKLKGNKLSNYWISVNLGYTYLRSGELTKAFEIFVQSLQQFVELNRPDGIAYSLEGVASLIISLGDAQQAARLIGRADAAREAMQNVRPPIEQADVDRDTETIIEMIGEEAHAAAYGEGRKMTTEKAITEVLEIGDFLQLSNT